MDPLAIDERRPIGMVLSGGGARGAFQVGVWEVLTSSSRGLRGPVAVISGTSAGALNGALIAAGVSPRRMMDFWLDLAKRPPVIANDKLVRSARAAIGKLLLREPLRALGRRGREARILFGLLGKHNVLSPAGIISAVIEFVMTARFDNVSEILDAIDTTYVFDTEPMKQRLRKVIGGDVLTRTNIRLALNAVDVTTGKVVRIVNHPPSKRKDASATHYRYEPAITPEMILASASIPLLFKPVRVHDQSLWDGGLLVNTPLAPAVALGARRIIPVLVTPHRREPPSHAPTLGYAVECLADAFLENAYNVDRKLLLDRNTLSDRHGVVEFQKVELFRAIRPESGRTFNAGSYLFFERDALMAMYEAGRQAAQRWLSEGPILDDPTAE